MSHDIRITITRGTRVLDESHVKTQSELNTKLRTMITNCFNRFPGIPSTSECLFTIEKLDKDSFVIEKNVRPFVKLDEVGIDAVDVIIPSAYGITVLYCNDMIIGFRLELNFDQP
jgi:hypothetical protein